MTILPRFSKTECFVSGIILGALIATMGFEGAARFVDTEINKKIQTYTQETSK